MRVKFTVQVLSHSVSAGMRTQITAGCLPPTARATSDFVEKVNMLLFDLLNSTRPFGDKPTTCAITAVNDVINQLTVLQQWISDWQLKSQRCMNTVKCIWGLQVSMGGATRKILGGPVKPGI